MRDEKRDTRGMRLGGYRDPSKMVGSPPSHWGGSEPGCQGINGAGSLARQRAELSITPTVPGALPPNKPREHRTGMGEGLSMPWLRCQGQGLGQRLGGPGGLGQEVTQRMEDTQKEVGWGGGGSPSVKGSPGKTWLAGTKEGPQLGKVLGEKLLHEQPAAWRPGEQSVGLERGPGGLSPAWQSPRW